MILHFLKYFCIKPFFHDIFEPKSTNFDSAENFEFLETQSYFWDIFCPFGTFLQSLNASAQKKEQLKHLQKVKTYFFANIYQFYKYAKNWQ
jgi:hypothetical protein